MTAASEFDHFRPRVGRGASRATGGRAPGESGTLFSSCRRAPGESGTLFFSCRRAPGESGTLFSSCWRPGGAPGSPARGILGPGTIGGSKKFLFILDLQPNAPAGARPGSRKAGKRRPKSPSPKKDPISGLTSNRMERRRAPRCMGSTFFLPVSPGLQGTFRHLATPLVRFPLFASRGVKKTRRAQCLGRKGAPSGHPKHCPRRGNGAPEARKHSGRRAGRAPGGPRESLSRERQPFPGQGPLARRPEAFGAGKPGPGKGGGARQGPRRGKGALARVPVQGTEKGARSQGNCRAKTRPATGSPF